MSETVRLTQDTGKLLRLRKWTNHFRPPPKGAPRPEFRIESESCNAFKGRVLVVLVLGDEPADGSEPLDANAVLEALGWTPPKTDDAPHPNPQTTGRPRPGSEHGE